MNNENRQLLYFVRTDIYAAASLVAAVTVKDLPDWARTIALVALWVAFCHSLGRSIDTSRASKEAK